MARRDVTAARRASSALPESDIAVCIRTKTCGGAGLAATLKAGGLCASDDPCTTQWSRQHRFFRRLGPWRNAQRSSAASDRRLDEEHLLSKQKLG